MKIIDFERKGNVIRFYLGNDDCNDYWGDDWNDSPYEDNAGRVYDRYIKGIKDVAIGFDDLVLEPQNNWTHDSRVSKEDMKKGLTPCVIIVPKSVHGDGYNDEFRHYVGASDWVFKVYLGDDIEKVAEMIETRFQV